MEDKKDLLYLSIITIVAIIGIVVLVLLAGPTSQLKTNNHNSYAIADENIAGGAYYLEIARMSYALAAYQKCMDQGGSGSAFAQSLCQMRAQRVYQNLLAYV